MKKLVTNLSLALFALVFFAGSVMAQTVIFSEDFESVPNDGSIPSNWTLIDADGDGENWYSLIGYENDGMPGNNGSSGFLTSASWVGGTILTPNNWVITPQINLGNGSMVKYYVCAQDASYPDDHYGIFISTTGTNPANFTLLFEETLTASRAQGVWFERNIDLSSYDNQQVYIAWRHYNCSDAFRMNLDDISVSTGNVGISETATVDVTIYPNPVSDVLNVKSPESIDHLELYDALGRMVISTENISGNGSIDISNLESGVYILRVRTADKVGEYKVVKR